MSARQARRNRWQALCVRPRTLAIALLASAAALVVLIVLLRMHADRFATLLTRAIDYPLLLVVVAAWLIATTVARRRRAARRAASQSWLAALPLDVTSFERNARSRMALGLLATLAIIGVAFLAIATSMALPQRLTMTLLILIATAALAGFALGWSIGGKDRRILRLRLPGTRARLRNDRHALGRWPLRHSRAHADVGLHTRAIGALLLSLPMGTPGYAALCIIVIGLMSFACWDLLRALLATSMQAGGWLRSLPLRPAMASIALLAPSLIALLIASALVAAALLPSGIAPALLPLTVVGVVLIGGVGFAVVCGWQRPFGARR